MDEEKLFFCGEVVPFEALWPLVPFEKDDFCWVRCCTPFDVCFKPFCMESSG